MSSQRRTALAALVLLNAAGAAGAHPVPRNEHDRTVAVRLTHQGVRIEYHLEVDPWTLVYTDVPNLDVDSTSFKRPTDWYNAFAEAGGDVMAANLRATVNDRPLTFRCQRRAQSAPDSVQFDFVFFAEAATPPGGWNRFAFEDRNYRNEPGKLLLTLAADEGLVLANRVEPDAALQARPWIDLGPDDRKRLGSLSADFEVSFPSPAIDESPRAGGSTASRTLVGLLDSRHGLGLLLLIAAFFGALHALTPGHGKTLVAAYLVGERGTVGHAVLLGLVTTLTHTGSVILIALGLLYLFPDAVPATVQAVLGFVGGLLIAGLGVWLLVRRLAGQADHVHLPGASHHHHHGDVSVDSKRGVAGLIVLGISGGIVPCWDAIALLGIAIASSQLWVALPLLLAFSAGLAGVLVVIGVAVVKARNRVAAGWSESRLVKALPLVSAVMVTGIGLWLCRDALSP